MRCWLISVLFINILFIIGTVRSFSTTVSVQSQSTSDVTLTTDGVTGTSDSITISGISPSGATFASPTGTSSSSALSTNGTSYDFQEIKDIIGNLTARVKTLENEKNNLEIRVRILEGKGTQNNASSCHIGLSNNCTARLEKLDNKTTQLELQHIVMTGKINMASKKVHDNRISINALSSLATHLKIDVKSLQNCTQCDQVQNASSDTNAIRTLIEEIDLKENNTVDLAFQNQMLIQKLNSSINDFESRMNMTSLLAEVTDLQAQQAVLSRDLKNIHTAENNETSPLNVTSVFFNLTNIIDYLQEKLDDVEKRETHLENNFTAQCLSFAENLTNVWQNIDKMRNEENTLLVDFHSLQSNVSVLEQQLKWKLSVNDSELSAIVRNMSHDEQLVAQTSADVQNISMMVDELKSLLGGMENVTRMQFFELNISVHHLQEGAKMATTEVAKYDQNLTNLFGNVSRLEAALESLIAQNASIGVDILDSKLQQVENRTRDEIRQFDTQIKTILGMLTGNSNRLKQQHSIINTLEANLSRSLMLIEKEELLAKNTSDALEKVQSLLTMSVSDLSQNILSIIANLSSSENEIERQRDIMDQLVLNFSKNALPITGSQTSLNVSELMTGIEARFVNTNQSLDQIYDLIRALTENATSIMSGFTQQDELLHSLAANVTSNEISREKDQVRMKNISDQIQQLDQSLLVVKRDSENLYNETNKGFKVLSNNLTQILNEIHHFDTFAKMVTIDMGSLQANVTQMDHNSVLQIDEINKQLLALRKNISLTDDSLNIRKKIEELLTINLGRLEARFTSIENVSRLLDKTVNQDMKAKLNNVSQQIQTLQNAPTAKPSLVKKIAFYARLNKSVNLDLSRAIAYNDVRVNAGGAYDPNTGYFTAPVPGVYVFTLSVMAKVSEGMHVMIVKNNVEVGRVYSNDNGYDAASTSVIIELNVGDQVGVKHFFEQTHHLLFTDEPVNTFSGILVSG